jgi:uncharacterized protein YhfF
VIVITIGMPDGRVLSLNAETPDASEAMGVVPVEQLIKTVLCELTRCMCSLLHVSDDLSDTLPLVGRLSAQASVVDEAEEELRFQTALRMVSMDTDGARAADKLGQLIADGRTLAEALGELSADEEASALEHFMTLKRMTNELRQGD